MGIFVCGIKNTRNTLNLYTDDRSESRWLAWGLRLLVRFHGCLFSDLPTSRVYLEILSLWHVVDPFENLPSKYTNVYKHTTFFVRFLGLYEIFKWLSGKESACNAGHMGSIPVLEWSPGVGNVKPLWVTEHACTEIWIYIILWLLKWLDSIQWDLSDVRITFCLTVS